MGLPKTIKLKLLVLFVVVLFSSSMVSTTQASHSYDFDGEITDAWYADGEGDGKENDVFAIVTFSIVSPYTWNHITYEITLTLPSGHSDTYIVSRSTDSDELTIQNNFWNHATEEGWYEVSIVATLNCADTVTDSLIFDPPGGDNADPKSFDSD